MSELEELGAPSPQPPPPPANTAGEGWRKDKQGRDYITLPGRRGPLYRRGDETVQERVERDKRPPDEKPKGKGRKKPPQQAPPQDVDLKAIEAALAEALRSPAMIAGLAGDVYLANHFTMWGPRLARNLVVSAEHNPWLRRQLETIATGGNTAVAMMSLLGLAGGVLAYVAPPIIYMFNLPAPAMAREMFQIPERRNGTGPPAAAAPVPQGA